MPITASLSLVPTFAGRRIRDSKNVNSRGIRRDLRVRAEGEESKPAKVDRSKDTLYFATEQSLSYLDGSLAGDFGFDPLGLSDPEGAGAFISPKWLAHSEIIHCRFAMLGAAGCIAPEALGKMGVIPESTGIAWYKNGVVGPSSVGFEYWTDLYTLFSMMMVLMGFAELRRLMDYRNPGSMGKQYFLGLESVLGGSGDPSYPGGAFFNLFNLGKTPESMKDLKLKEVKNGRLAMLAMLGFFLQAMLTGEGPVQNLQDHLSDPVANNILTNFGRVGGSI